MTQIYSVLSMYDELIEMIERYDGSARFTPEFPDEPFANAA